MTHEEFMKRRAELFEEAKDHMRALALAGDDRIAEASERLHGIANQHKSAAREYDASATMCANEGRYSMAAEMLKKAHEYKVKSATARAAAEALSAALAGPEIDSALSWLVALHEDGMTD